MAGKSGGSWKVAYADFVTAMMAFFLVMWIGAQDTKTKQAVANYFIDPSGVSKKPSQAGAVFETQAHGSVPKDQSVEMGKGRLGHTTRDNFSPATRSVSDSVLKDDAQRKRWKSEGIKHLESANRSQDVKDKKIGPHALAAKTLAKQMQTDITKAVATDSKGLYQDLLYGSFAEVNWVEIAEDLLRE